MKCQLEAVCILFLLVVIGCCLQHVHVTEEFGAYEYEQRIPDHQFSLQKASF